MPKQYGTLQILDELSTIDNANIFEYGEDALYQHIRDILAVHNMLTQDILGDFVGTTTDNIRRYGASAVTGEMVEVDEWGAADVQKTLVAGYDIGFPLRAYQYAIGWTRKYFETHTVADMAQNLVAAQTADIRNIKFQVTSALFKATNTNFIDRLVNNQTLPLKALQNADGTAIPINEFGTTFDGSTHTHLVGRAAGALAAADITALVNNVVEHGVNGGTVNIYINRVNQGAVEAFTANFKPYQAPLLDPGPGSTADVVAGGTKANPYRLDNKPIGVWDGYVTVWVKPWVPANYIICLLVGDNSRGDVLEFRTRGGAAGYGSLRLVSDHDHFPLRAQHTEREFGVSVWNRLGCAILYTGGGPAYTAPTLTM